MYLTREENYRYQKLSLAVLEKALDDICPTFEHEPEPTRQNLIKDRIKCFKQHEKELDKEWKDLEIEAARELNQFKKDRDKIAKKLEKTVKTKRIDDKVKDLEQRKKIRIESLESKKLFEQQILNQKMVGLNRESRKYLQVKKKLNNLIKDTKDKIRKSEIRFNTIINNTLNSDNSTKVEQRLKQSHEVWERKYQKLKNKFNDREIIHNNKRYELDQVRLAIDGFVQELDRITHWCTSSGVSIKACYTVVRNRIIMMDREVPEFIEKVININT